MTFHKQGYGGTIRIDPEQINQLMQVGSFLFLGKPMTLYGDRKRSIEFYNAELHVSAPCKPDTYPFPGPGIEITNEMFSGEEDCCGVLEASRRRNHTI